MQLPILIRIAVRVACVAHCRYHLRYYLPERVWYRCALPLRLHCLHAYITCPLLLQVAFGLPAVHVRVGLRFVVCSLPVTPDYLPLRSAFLILCYTVAVVYILRCYLCVRCSLGCLGHLRCSCYVVRFCRWFVAGCSAVVTVDFAGCGLLCCCPDCRLVLDSFQSSFPFLFVLIVVTFFVCRCVAVRSAGRSCVPILLCSVCCVWVAVTVFAVCCPFSSVILFYVLLGCVVWCCAVVLDSGLRFWVVVLYVCLTVAVLVRLRWQHISAVPAFVAVCGFIRWFGFVLRTCCLRVWLCLVPSLLRSR